MRVAAEKLDTFLAHNGELLIARRRVEARAEDLGPLREFVGRWKNEWRAAQKSLADFLKTADRDHGHAGRQRQPDRFGGPQPAYRTAPPTRSGTSAATCASWKETWSTWQPPCARTAVCSRKLPARSITRCGTCGCCRSPRPCQGLDRMVHDLARSTAKEVELYVDGGDVELDRSVLEGLKDPLRHLVRNAVDHGVEPPEARLAAGKPRQRD